jgi:hypothetical protein
MLSVGTTAMSGLSFVLLIVTALLLTAYFGMAAWRTTGDRRADITSHVPPSYLNEWKPVPKN